MKDGSEVAWSEPFFVLDFRNRDSLAEPRPVSGAVVAANGRQRRVIRGGSIPVAGQAVLLLWLTCEGVSDREQCG